MSVLRKKLFRHLKEGKGQFIAVTVVILLGLLGFSSVKNAYENLEKTQNRYYEENQFAHLEAHIFRAPKQVLERLESIPGISKVTGRLSKDMNLKVHKGEEAISGRFVSYPAEEREVVNQLFLLEGTYLSKEKPKGILIDPKFAEAHGLKVGDEVFPIVNGKEEAFEVIGIATSPEFIYLLRRPEDLMPRPKEYGVFFINDSLAQTIWGYEEDFNQAFFILEQSAKLDKVKLRVEEVLKPYGLTALVERDNQLSHVFLEGELTQLEGMANSFPVIFLGVAAAIIYVMMTRLVKTQRGQIGVMKALGYTDKQVFLHYLSYALIMSLPGAILGLLVGFYLGTLLTQYYTLFFNLPLMEIQVYWDIIVPALFLTCLFVGFATYRAIRKTVQLDPMLALRPETPVSKGRILLERMPFFWKKLTFQWRMTFRSLSRNKQRALLSIMGVVFSVALLVMGSFTSGAFEFIIEDHFVKGQKYDVRVTFSSAVDSKGFKEMIKTYPIDYGEPLLEVPVEVTKGWKQEKILLTGIYEKESLIHAFTVQGHQADISEGLWLSDRVANELGVQAGDMVEVEALTPGGRTKSLRITGVIKQMIGSDSYVGAKTLGKLSRSEGAITKGLLLMPEDQEDLVVEELKEVSKVGSVESKNRLVASFYEFAELSLVSSFMFYIFGGILGFAIIYNATVVNIADRNRELASLKVLGYTRTEIRQLIFNENLIVGIGGIILGLPMGYLFIWAIAESSASEVFSFPVMITPSAYLTAAIVASFFVFLAQVATYKKLDRIDMVEVLKSKD